MIRIAITQAAYDAIAATLPLGSVGYEAQRSADGQIFIWLDEGAVNRLKMLRGKGESYSDVIFRLKRVVSLGVRGGDAWPLGRRSGVRLAGVSLLTSGLAIVMW
jgi:hypothetical protein